MHKIMALLAGTVALATAVVCGASWVGATRVLGQLISSAEADPA